MNLKSFRLGLAFLIMGLGNFTSFAQSISGITPAFGSVGESVRINGSGFASVTNVIFYNNKSVRVSPTSGTQINAIVPTGATTGGITVGATTSGDFTVIGKEPYVTDFTPTSGSDIEVTLNGVHFTGVTNARFNGTNVMITQLTTDTQIKIFAPANVSTGPISLTRSNLTFTTSSNFFAPVSITSFLPANGRPGTNIVVKGKNFLGATIVKFNNVATPSFTVDSNTQITVILPTNATTGVINVTVPGSQFNSSSNFVVLPTLYSFSPFFGRPGTNVTLVGANLLGNTKVKFNGGPDVTPISLSSTQLVVIVPANTTSGAISVITTNGTAISPTNFFIPPTISGFTPTSGAPGAVINLTGANFTNATDVRFNGLSAPFTVVNNGSINATVPAGAVSGPISVSAPGGSATNSQNFFISPTITSFAPGSGLAGNTITIFGTSFTNASAVKFNGINAAFTAGNNSQLTAIVPTNATTGPISVVTPGGTGTSAVSFIVEVLTLKIKFVTNNAVSISWATNATGFNLEASTNLSVTNWVLVTNLPTVINGQNTVTNGATTSAKFYRLRK